MQEVLVIFGLLKGPQSECDSLSSFTSRVKIRVDNLQVPKCRAQRNTDSEGARRGSFGLSFKKERETQYS